MVVLSASIINKSGKPLLSRQFVDIPRAMIEGYLAAFPKLVGTGKEHTYVETENVRYVYQPMESLFLVLVTNKQSNILEDLYTLRLLSKLVPEYAYSLDDDGICKSAFELIFAFDEVISLGHKENVTIAQVNQYCEMFSHEEEMSKDANRNKELIVHKEMELKVIEIAKRKIVNNRSAKGGYLPLQSLDYGRIDSSFGNNTRLPSSGGGSVLGFSPGLDSVPKSKGQPPASATGAAGMKLGKTGSTNKFLESLKADGEVIVEDVRPNIITGHGQSKASAPVTLNAEEKLNIMLKRDGGLCNFDVHGTLSLQNLDLDNGHVQVKIETGGNHGIQYRTHPNINKELFSNENIIGLKDPNRPFPTGQSGDGGVGLLKWRMQTGEEKLVPLSINCWPSLSGKDTYVNIEYEASSMFDLQNVVISVPLPALREAPVVQQIDGDWRYDPRNHVLEWSVVLIDNSNRSGSMEFIVPAADPSVFSPISVRFTASNTFSDLKVVNIIPLTGGSQPKFSQRTLLSTDTYQVV